MNLLNLGEVKIITNKVELKRPRSRRIGCAAGDTRVFVYQMNIVETGLSPANVQVSIEQFDRFSISRSVRSVNVPLRLRISPRSRDLQRQIGGAGNRIIDSSQGSG